MKVKVTVYYGNSREEKHFVSFIGDLSDLDTKTLQWFSGLKSYLYTVISNYDEDSNK